MLEVIEIEFKGYIISNDKSKISIEAVASLLSNTYWASQRSKEKITESIKNSLCFGIYLNNRQVGFSRVVTDYATVYWLCDVIIDQAHRNQGLSKKMLELIVNSKELKGLFGILGTLDAHGLYEQFGFEKEPQRFMKRLHK